MLPLNDVKSKENDTKLLMQFQTGTSFPFFMAFCHTLPGYPALDIEVKVKNRKFWKLAVAQAESIMIPCHSTVHLE